MREHISCPFSRRSGIKFKTRYDTGFIGLYANTALPCIVFHRSDNDSSASIRIINSTYFKAVYPASQIGRTIAYPFVVIKRNDKNTIIALFQNITTGVGFSRNRTQIIGFNTFFVAQRHIGKEIIFPLI